MKDFRDLRVWERSHKLTLDIYRITASFPKHELYGLTSQIRRCSASIGANGIPDFGEEPDGITKDADIVAEEG